MRRNCQNTCLPIETRAPTCVCGIPCCCCTLLLPLFLLVFFYIALLGSIPSAPWVWQCAVWSECMAVPMGTGSTSGSHQCSPVWNHQEKVGKESALKGLQRCFFYYFFFCFVFISFLSWRREVLGRTLACDPLPAACSMGQKVTFPISFE